MACVIVYREFCSGPGSSLHVVKQSASRLRRFRASHPVPCSFSLNTIQLAPRYLSSRRRFSFTTATAPMPGGESGGVGMFCELRDAAAVLGFSSR